MSSVGPTLPEVYYPKEKGLDHFSCSYGQFLGNDKKGKKKKTKMVLRSEFFRRRNQENSREKLFFLEESAIFFFKAHDLFKYTAMTPPASLGGGRIK